MYRGIFFFFFEKLYYRRIRHEALTVVKCNHFFKLGTKYKYENNVERGRIVSETERERKEKSAKNKLTETIKEGARIGVEKRGEPFVRTTCWHHDEIRIGAVVLG